MPRSSGDVLVAVKKYYLTATRTSPLLLSDICEKILNRLLDSPAKLVIHGNTERPTSNIQRRTMRRAERDLLGDGV